MFFSCMSKNDDDDLELKITFLENEINNLKSHLVNKQNIITKNELVNNRIINKLESKNYKLYDEICDLKNEIQDLKNLLDIPDIFNCLICMDNIKTIAVIPCYHLIYCQKCYDIQNANYANSNYNRLLSCPICRKNISSYQKIFV